MKKSLITFLSLYLLAAGNSLPAADIEKGRKLQQRHCMSCHDDSMYTRDNRRIKSMSSLRTQVQRCESTLGLKWFDTDIDAVAAYLNQSYYHFK